MTTAPVSILSCPTPIPTSDQNQGSHGITTDTLGVHIAKTRYGDYDFQNKGYVIVSPRYLALPLISIIRPGHRPKISSPDPVEVSNSIIYCVDATPQCISLQFLFEPLRLKDILDWSLQQDIVRDLEHASLTRPGLSTTQISRVKASFALFRCYIHEFGVIYDAERACHWLRMAAESEGECEEKYLAQAWCWRIHRALGITLDVELSTLRDWIHISVLRGHRKCITESLSISSLIDDSDEKKLWKEALEGHTAFLNKLTGGVGMPYFVPRKLRRAYDLSDLNGIHDHIQAEFSLRGVDSLDEIYVNHRGDGLLHMAAAMGNLAALKHLIEVYEPNIDIKNKADYDTPLMSACRGGHLDCALFLLDIGANAQGGQFANDTPLHWLSAFTDTDIPIVAQKLHACGATLKSNRNYRLQHNNMWADSESLFMLPTSPLSRAVMVDRLPAVKMLLALGADPLEGVTESEFPSISAIVLAAVLTLPRHLEVMLAYVDAMETEVSRIFTDMEMLRIAIDKVAAIVDATSLESRLSRTGPDYKSAMFETLELLHLQDQKSRRWETEGNKHRADAEKTMLARMVHLGRVDIVDTLLRLGHPINGMPCASPIVECVKLNHDILFRLLIGHGADVFVKVSAPNGAQHSLLQVSADRPSQSRPGLFIPHYLLKRGIPVDPFPDGSRSAFVSAVKNQDFALADLLLRHGADIDFAYIFIDNMPWITVFGELIQIPTEKNVESIKYVLGIDEEPALPGGHQALAPIPQAHAISRQSNRLPGFTVDKENNLSVLHLAAIHELRSDAESLILGQMVVHILSEKTYCTTEAIDNCHPIVGTALWAATLRCNLEVVSALLEKKATPNLAFEGITPLKIALEANHQPSSEKLDKTAKLHRRKRYGLIADVLRSAGAKASVDT
jgi:ankyrin repeat protein